MNTLIWGAQIALALKFVSVTISHGLRPDAEKMARGRERLGGLARPLLILSAVGTFLGGVGVVLPAATGFRPELTGWAAALRSETAQHHLKQEGPSGMPVRQNPYQT
jgi:hypothetical protein